MNNKLSLAYSTCPNDTFIFHALVHGLITDFPYELNTVLADVETLNQEAKVTKYDISKLSFAAIGYLQESYGLLRSGAALGRGCGPLLVTGNSNKKRPDKRSRIAVPGMWTTANLLLGLFLPEKPEIVPMTFDKIMPAVQSGDYDFGVIIHESRFTYSDYGLECIQDLGQWWEQETGLPIPLGGIAVRRDLPKELIQNIEAAISQSVSYAFKNRSASKDYIKQFAAEMNDNVISQHIDLYVNDFSYSLGEEGGKAIEYLFKKARERGIIPSSDKPLFAC